MSHFFTPWNCAWIAILVIITVLFVILRRSMRAEKQKLSDELVSCFSDEVFAPHNNKSNNPD